MDALRATASEASLSPVGDSEASGAARAAISLARDSEASGIARIQRVIKTFSQIRSIDHEDAFALNRPVRNAG